MTGSKKLGKKWVGGSLELFLLIRLQILKISQIEKSLRVVLNDHQSILDEMLDKLNEKGVHTNNALTVC